MKSILPLVFLGGQLSLSAAPFNAWIDARDGGEYDLCWQTKAGKVYTIEAADSLEGWQSLGDAPSFYGTAYEQRYHVLTVEGGGGGGSTPPDDDGKELVNVYVEVFADGKAFLTWNIQDEHHQYVEDTVDLRGMPVLALHEGDTYQYNLFTLENNEPTLRPGMASATYSQLPAAQRAKADDLRTTYDSLYENVILAYANGSYLPASPGGGNPGAAGAGDRHFYRVQEADTDTDGDGIFDHDEIYTTRTNPFTPFSSPLPGSPNDFDADADGDGVSNGDELASGGDPLDFYNGNPGFGNNPFLREESREGERIDPGIRSFLPLAAGLDSRYFLTRTTVTETREELNATAGGAPLYSLSEQNTQTDVTEAGFPNIFTTGNTGSIYSVNFVPQNNLVCQDSWADIPLEEIPGCPRPAGIHCSTSSGQNNGMLLSESAARRVIQRIDRLYVPDPARPDTSCSGHLTVVETSTLEGEVFPDEFLEELTLEVETKPWESGGLTPRASVVSQATTTGGGKGVYTKVVQSRYRIFHPRTTIPFRATWEKFYFDKFTGIQTKIGELEWVHTGDPDQEASPYFDLEPPVTPGDSHVIRNLSVDFDVEAGLRAHVPGRIGDPTAVVDRDPRSLPPGEDEEERDEKYYAMLDSNYDADEGNGGFDYDDSIAGEDDDDLVKIDILLDPVDTESGFVQIKLPSGVRAFDSDGRVIGQSELTIDLARPIGKLATLRNGAASLWLEGKEGFSGGTVEMKYRHALGRIKDEVQLIATQYVRETSPGSGEYVHLMSPPKYVHHDGVDAGIDDELLFPGYSEAQERLSVSIKFSSELTGELIESASLLVHGGENTSVDSDGLLETATNSRVFADLEGSRFEIRGASNFDSTVRDTLEIALIDPIDSNRYLFKLRETGVDSLKFRNRDGVRTNRTPKNPNESSNQFRIRVLNISDSDGFNYSLFQEGFEEEEISLTMTPISGGTGLISEPILLADNGESVPELDPRTRKLMLKRERNARSRERLRFKLEKEAIERLLSKAFTPIEPALLAVALEGAAAGNLGGREAHLANLDTIISSKAAPGSGAPALGYAASTKIEDIDIIQFRKELSKHSIFYCVAHGEVDNPYSPNLDNIDFRGTYINSRGVDVGEPDHRLSKDQIIVANKGKVHSLVFLNSCAGANNSFGVADEYRFAFLAQNYVSWQRPCVVGAAAIAAIEFFGELDNGVSVEVAASLISGKAKVTGLAAAATTVIDIPLVVIDPNNRVIIDLTP